MIVIGIDSAIDIDQQRHERHPQHDEACYTDQQASLPPPAHIGAARHGSMYYYGRLRCGPMIVIGIDSAIDIERWRTTAHAIPIAKIQWCM